MQELNQVIKAFPSIGLAQMGKAELMNRVDTKFVLPYSDLPGLLLAVKDQYKVLEIDGNRMQAYQTRYWDTPSFHFYHQHHNERINRFKVRFRSYLNSNLFFLEVKHKDQKGKTNKTRIVTKALEEQLSPHSKGFLSQLVPELADKLVPTVESTFTRITLAAPEREERLTIDLDLGFDGLTASILREVVILEVKLARNGSRSPLLKELKSMHHRPMRVSKYCIGASLLNPHLKQNRFKAIFQQIKKITHGALVQSAN